MSTYDTPADWYDKEPTSYEDTRIPVMHPSGQVEHVQMDDLAIDEELRHELKQYCKFKAFFHAPRSVVLVYEDDEDPVELGRWLWQARNGEDLPTNALVQPRFGAADLFRIGKGEQYLQADEIAVEYRLGRSQVVNWRRGKGAPPKDCKGLASTGRFKLWRPWGQQGDRYVAFTDSGLGLLCQDYAATVEWAQTWERALLGCTYLEAGKERQSAVGTFPAIMKSMNAAHRNLAQANLDGAQKEELRKVMARIRQLVS